MAETLPVVRQTDEGDILGPPKMDPKFGNPTTPGLMASVTSGAPVTLAVGRAISKKR